MRTTAPAATRKRTRRSLAAREHQQRQQSRGAEVKGDELDREGQLGGDQAPGCPDLRFVEVLLVWKLSKCIHIAGDGLASRPLGKVSPASRWANSSWMSGAGTGISGKSARRAMRAVAPTVSTASARRRASRPSARSAASSHVEPSPSRTRAAATATASKTTSSTQAGRGPSATA
jgi:hypothetical protein